jgi:hypothetical protein
MENLELRGITQDESDKRRELVNYASRIVQASGFPITAKMRELDARHISGEIDSEEYGRLSCTP